MSTGLDGRLLFGDPPQQIRRAGWVSNGLLCQNHAVVVGSGPLTRSRVKSLIQDALSAAQVEHVMQKLGEHSSPEAMLEEMQPILDTDAEKFVLKLYRFVVYESEKAKELM